MGKLPNTLASIVGSSLVALTAAMPLAAHAQSPDGFEEAERSSRRLPFLNDIPFGGIATIASLSRAWSVNSFYIVRARAVSNPAPFWVIRRQTRRPFSGAVALRWADSRACPAVEKVLLAMEDLPLVRPDAPRLGQEANVPGRGPDGMDHLFWNRHARSGAKNATVSLEIAGSSGAPVDLWWEHAEQQLAKCWAENPPAA